MRNISGSGTLVERNNGTMARKILCENDFRRSQFSTQKYRMPTNAIWEKDVFYRKVRHHETGV